MCLLEKDGKFVNKIKYRYRMLRKSCWIIYRDILYFKTKKKCSNKYGSI